MPRIVNHHRRQRIADVFVIVSTVFAALVGTYAIFYLLME